MDSKVYCIRCEKYVSKKNFKRHIKNHKYIIKDYKENIDDVLCTICNKYIAKKDTSQHYKDEKGGGKMDDEKVVDDIIKDVNKIFKTFENDKFKIEELNYRFNKKFNVKEIDFRIIFKSQHIDDLGEIFKEMLQHLNLKEDDRLDIIINHPNFSNPISTGLVKYGGSTGEVYRTLVDTTGRMLNSNETIDLRDAIINVRVLNIPDGQRGDKILNIPDSIYKKASIIRIKNNDNYCLPRAIIVALTYLVENNKVKEIFKNLNENDLNISRIKYIKDCRKTLQQILAVNLLKICDIDKEKFIGTLDDIKKIESNLDIQINVVCSENFNNIIYNGIDKEIKIYLYKIKNHFHVIKSIAGFYGTSYYCNEHKYGYNNKNGCKHCKKEKNLCQICKSTHEENIDWKYCDKCFRCFLNKKCYDNHLEIVKNFSVCNTIWKCLKCKKNLLWEQYIPALNNIISNKKVHLCDHSECKNCKEYVNIDEHKCFIQNLNSQTKELDENYIFFDFECHQNTGVHQVNYANAQYFDGTSFEFNDYKDFCNWLISDKHKNYTAFAHNAKGYDSYFILKYCIENGLKPYTIYNGAKIMLLEINSLKLKVQDSMNLVSGSLKNFPKTFGLKELKKGYFPHYFNKYCNYNYIGKLPSKKHYGYNSMSTLDREKFLEWYNKNCDKDFNFQKELKDYCKSDVDILRRGLIELRKNFIEIVNIDPLKYLTIASVCMNIYRSLDMPKDSIAVIKESNDNFSKKSIYWLEYLMNKNYIFIQHAMNKGEKIVDNKKVDGFENNTIYQFYDCFWHGCQKCYNNTNINPKNKISMKDLYDKTIRESNKFKENYNVIEIWECDYDCLTKTKDFKDFKKKYNQKHSEIITRLNPRDAFFGGRTNATKLYYKCKPNEIIKYVDFVSLYPTVQFYDYFPKGHPEIITSTVEYDENWFGMIKCKILPPRKLYHPVLPVKIKTKQAFKLLFPLCYSCAKNQNQEKCNHNDNDRCLIGTWCSNEIKKSIEKGYKIQETYEVHNFEQKSNELFASYVKRFMKIKQESSGLPKGYTKEQYIIENYNQLGILLDPDIIEYNPGRRAIAKFCLNSLWGKFGQRKNLKQSEYITDPKRFYTLILDEKLNNITYKIINDEMIEMFYQYKDVFVNDCVKTNEYIAAFTTANARMRLYKVLDILGDKVVYFDTDSIKYIDDGYIKTIKIGSLLGDLTLEYNIIETVSTGPKSYSDKEPNNNTHTKVKGFTLNFENSQVINHNQMIKIVKGEIKERVLVDENKITRDTKNKTIVNKYQEKVFKFEYDKRVIKTINEDNIDTLPYGY